MADDPIEALGVGLAADHAAEKKASAKTRREREKSRRDFQLDEQQAESLRSAMEGEPSAMEMFWRRMGPEIGFDPESVVLKSTPESGPIAFTAIPADVAELHEALDSLGADVAQQADGDADADQGDHEVMPAIARLERIAAESLPEGRALIRFATTFMLDQIKHSPRWGDLLEAGQRDLAATLQANATDLVTKIVEAVRANGAQPIRALLESYNEKDGIKASLKIKPQDDEEALQAIIGLHRAQGKNVFITLASAQDFDQSPAEIPITPDEPGLGFDAGTDDHPDDDSDLADEETDQEAGDAEEGQ